MSAEGPLAEDMKRALFLYRSEGRYLDYQDLDEAVEGVVRDLGATVEDFLAGRINFATVKYRMDNAAPATQSEFPPREVLQALSELSLGVDVDDLASAMRSLVPAPEDLGEAKGAFLDAEAFLERQARNGHIKASAGLLDRTCQMLQCLWHAQQPGGWPPPLPALRRLLRARGMTTGAETVEDAVTVLLEAAALSEALGTGHRTVDHVAEVLLEGTELPPTEVCVERSLERARALRAEGDLDASLLWFDTALVLAPGTREAVEAKIEIYEAKGMVMMAVAEAEALVDAHPRSLSAHRRLLALYKGKKMVKDYNREVRRFKDLMLPGQLVK